MTYREEYDDFNKFKLNKLNGLTSNSTEDF